MAKSQIFKAQVTTPFGEFTLAVDSIEQDARSDLYTAAIAEFNCPAGMLRVKDITKSSKRLVNSMQPIKKAQSNGHHWAWINFS